MCAKLSVIKGLNVWSKVCRDSNKQPIDMDITMSSNIMLDILKCYSYIIFLTYIFLSRILFLCRGELVIDSKHYLSPNNVVTR